MTMEEKLEAAGITSFMWCGVKIYQCPHPGCHTMNEFAGYMLAHVRDHLGDHLGDDGEDAAEAGAMIDDEQLAQLPSEGE